MVYTHHTTRECIMAQKTKFEIPWEAAREIFIQLMKDDYVGLIDDIERLEQTKSLTKLEDYEEEDLDQYKAVIKNIEFLLKQKFGFKVWIQNDEHSNINLNSMVENKSGKSVILTEGIKELLRRVIRKIPDIEDVIDMLLDWAYNRHPTLHRGAGYPEFKEYILHILWVDHVSEVFETYEEDGDYLEADISREEKNKLMKTWRL